MKVLGVRNFVVLLRSEPEKERTEEVGVKWDQIDRSPYQPGGCGGKACDGNLYLEEEKEMKAFWPSDSLG
jgi:hypothetical protein